MGTTPDATHYYRVDLDLERSWGGVSGLYRYGGVGERRDYDDYSQRNGVQWACHLERDRHGYGFGRRCWGEHRFDRGYSGFTISGIADSDQSIHRHWNDLIGSYGEPD